MKITLEQILDLYNFRNYRDELKFENHRYDTQIIRIYLDNDLRSDCRYVEFGIYDFGEEEYKREIYKEFITDEILKREVSSIYYDEDLETFCISLYKGDDN